MMHILKNFSNETRKNPLFAISCSFGLAMEAKNDFINYKLGRLNNLSKERLLEMEILLVLEKLGFPIDASGTYLYKDMIAKAYHELDGYDFLGDVVTNDELLKKMKNPYSQFYIDVARNDWDIGLKTFHSYIEHSLERVDLSNIDMTLHFEIYGDFSKRTDYGEHAFIIAKHMKKVMKNCDGFQYHKNIDTVSTAF